MQSIEELEREAQAEVSAAGDTSALKELEIKYLGKSGLYTGLLRQIGQLPPAEKPTFGQKVNEAKARLQSLIDVKNGSLKGGELAEQFERERIDVTMPGRPTRYGNEHVLQQAANKIK